MGKGDTNGLSKARRARISSHLCIMVEFAGIVILELLIIDLLFVGLSGEYVDQVKKHE